MAMYNGRPIQLFAQLDGIEGGSAYFAEYGTTTYDEIAAALNAAEEVLCKKDGYIYSLQQITEDLIQFTCTVEESSQVTVKHISCSNLDTWNTYDDFFAAAINSYTTFTALTDVSLYDGDIVRTSGFYDVNDGGAGEYIIRDSQPTNALYVTVGEKYAELIECGYINIRALGAKESVDIKSFILDCIEAKDHPKIYIPAGIWKCSDCEIDNQKGFELFGDYSFPQMGYANEGTIITSLNSSQAYVLKVGKGSSSQTSNRPLSNFSIKGITFSSAVYSNGAVSAYNSITRGALVLETATFGKIDVNFSAINGTALAITDSWEIYFGDISFRNISNVAKPCLVFETAKFSTSSGSNISALDFKSLMFEACCGKYIEAQTGCKLDSNHIGAINIEGSFDTQKEGTQSISDTTPDVILPMLDITETIGLQIDAINIQHFYDYLYTTSGTTYKVGVLINIPEGGLALMQVGAVTIALLKNGFSLLNSTRPNTRSAVQFGDINIYQESLIDTSAENLLPYFNLTNFSKVEIGNFYFVKNSNRNLVYPADGITPLYPHGFTSISNGIASVCSDIGCLNPARLGVKAKGTGTNVAVATFTATGAKCKVHVKAPADSTMKFNVIGKRNGSDSGQTISVTGTGAFVWVEVPTDTYDIGTNVTLYEHGDNHNTYADTLVFDCLAMTAASGGGSVPATTNLLSGDGSGGISNSGASLSQIEGITADAWNVSATYAVGDLRIHNDILWKCLVTNSGQEPVSGSTSWNATSVAECVNKLSYFTYSTGYVAAPKGDVTQIGSVSVPKGVWLAFGVQQWSESIDAVGAFLFGSETVRNSMISGGGSICATLIINTSAPSELRLRVYQSALDAVNANATAYLIKIA